MFKITNLTTGQPTKILSFLPQPPTREEIRAARIKQLDYLCHDHQEAASRCGCLDIDDYCWDCNGQITSQYDGRYCLMCDYFRQPCGCIEEINVLCKKHKNQKGVKL